MTKPRDEKYGLTFDRVNEVLEYDPVIGDHENRVRDDNRWTNLREATHSQNHANCGTRSDNTSGFKGVQFCKQKQKYVAIAIKDGKRHHAGFHATPEAASAAYEVKAKELHGVFASAA